MGTLIRKCLSLLCIGVLLSGVRPENDRLKRSTNSECKDKFKVIPEHSICLTKSKDASNSGVSIQDRAEIVTFHNRLRAIPEATNMLKLEWDDEIATIAQHWADSCNIRHDSGARRSIPGIYSLGQNLAMNAGNWTISIQLWYDEVKVFNYGGENVLEKVGHYTQLVWADTHRIGCGYADCPGTKYYVCNYGPGGNSGDNWKPYKKGTKGSDCGTNFKDDLCECPSPCLNGGTLHRNNCTCTCKDHDFYIARDNCALNCSNVEEDPAYCSQDYGKQDCMLIYLDCPNKCKICPYGGVGYIEEEVVQIGGCSTSTPGHAALLVTALVVARSVLFC